MAQGGLTAEQRERVDRLAGDAVLRPSGERIGFVEAAAADDPAVREEVIRLVRDAESGGASTVVRALEAIPSLPGAARELPERIGPYHVLGLIGEGGFGVVYAAERRDPIVQRVAVKVIKPGMDSAAVIARFEQERQALAVMDHPNVARVFDAGTTDQGRPYFVMEHVQGESIVEYCDRHTQSLRERLELFIPVCEAIQHAHHKGIIHRDIKPSNILVGVKEGRATPKVIDFGVAKAISHTLTDRTIFTERGQIIGTPEYMSPEQAEMGAVDIDTRTDVYSLGVVLYELLSGCLPFEPGELRSAGYDEIRRVIREVDAPRPSTRLSSLAQSGRAQRPPGPARAGSDPLDWRSTDPRPAPPGDRASRIADHRRMNLGRLKSELRSELDWIPLKAIRKNRTERYASPLDLARDVRNYLGGSPLEAGPERFTYRLRKFTRRNRRAVAAACLVSLALIVASVGATILAQAAESERRQLVAERGASDRTRLFITNVRRELRAMGNPGPPPREGGLPPREAFRVASEQARRFKDRPEEQARIFVELAELAASEAPGADHDQLASAAAEAAMRLPFEHRRLFKVFVDVTRVLITQRQFDRAAAVLDRVRFDMLPAGTQVAQYHQLRAEIAAGRRDEPAARALSDLSYRILTDASTTLTNDGIAVLGARHKFLMDRNDPGADEPLRLVVATRRAGLGDDAPELAASLHQLGGALVDLGRPAEAVPILQEALQIRRTAFGNDRYPGVPETQALLRRAQDATTDGPSAPPGASNR